MKNVRLPILRFLRGGIKPSLVVKFLFLLLIASFFQVNASNYSQTMKFSFEMKNAKVEDVLHQIEENSDFRFFYQREQVNVERKVNLNVKNLGIEAILLQLFKEQEVIFDIRHDNLILIKAKSVLSEMMNIDSTSPKQQNSIRGRVTDSQNQPIPGVTVVIKGTTNGTTTGGDGNYLLNNVPSGSILVFSFVGMKTQEMRVEQQTKIDITLADETITLEELVAVGYGTQRKATLTGSVAAVSAKDIITTKNEGVVNTLAGKIPGVIVVQNSAEPGSYNNVLNIRGLGNPLIVIDGIAQENASAFLRLSPSDIESISVLKDASAAVYGFRSANGVVVITTKQGKSGKFSLEYDGFYGFQRQSGVPPVLGPVDFMQLENEFNTRGGYASGLIRTYSQEQMDEYRNGTKKGTDWIDITMLKNAPQTQHTLSATGGTDKISFYSSFGYLFQEGLFKNKSLTYNRYSFTDNIKAQLTKSINVNFNLNGIVDNKQSPYTDVTSFFSEVWNMNPLQAPYLTDTKEYPAQSWLDIKYNPLIIMQPDIVGSKKNNHLYLNSAFTLTYDAPFLPGLQLSATGSYNYWNQNNTYFRKKYNLYVDATPASLANPAVMNSPSQVTREFYVFTNWMTRVQAEYKKSFNDHNINVLVLAEQSQRKGDNFAAARDLIIPLPLLAAGLANENQLGTMDPGSGTTLYPYNYVNRAYVGRLNYDFRSKYMAEFSFRYDGSSKFIKDKQWGFFPSASLGWRISEEEFFKSTGFLSSVDNLKLRTSYGILGDDGAMAYQFMTGYNYPAISGNPGVIPAGAVFDGNFIPSTQNRGIANTSLTWYTSKTFNTGVDYSMWNEKLGVTFDYFVRNRSGLLATPAGAVPGVLGAAMPQQNLNSDRTLGYELALSHHSRIGELILDATLSTSFTRTYWKTRGDQAPRTNSYDNWLYNRNNRVSDVAMILKYEGQYQGWDDILNSPWFVSNTTLPGDPYFKDISGSGQQYTNGYIYNNAPFLINANGDFPLMNFGSTMNLQYKNFDVALVWQGSTLRWTQLPGAFTRFSIGTMYGNGITDFLDRWHPVDPAADPYDPTTEYVSGKYPYTGYTIPTNTTMGFQNASYLRLKSIELGFSLPSYLVKTMGIQNARIYVNGYNLFTPISYMPRYQDPEHPGARNSGGGYAYPLNKVINLGINIKF